MRLGLPTCELMLMASHASVRRGPKKGSVQVLRVLAWLVRVGQTALWVRSCDAGQSTDPAHERPAAAPAVSTTSWPPPVPGMARERWAEEVKTFLTPAWTPPLTIATSTECPAQALAIGTADHAIALACYPLQPDPVCHLNTRPCLPDQPRSLEAMHAFRNAGSAHAQVTAQHFVCDAKVIIQQIMRQQQPARETLLNRVLARA